MNGFEQYGEAMLLANEGNTQAGRALAAAFQRMIGSFKVWLHAMPSTLPPTESFLRK